MPGIFFAQMTDGLGTTAYAYLPFGQPGGGQLSVVDGPLANDALRYTFTHFGRQLRTENITEPVTAGSTVRQFMEHAYDLMGRSSTLTTDLGQSSLGYLSTNFTSKANSITHQLGGVDAVRSSFGYYTDAANLGRLQNITHAFAAGGGAWSTKVQHDYAYDVSGRITSWRWRTPAFDTQPAIDRRWQAGYDAADQLESVTSYSADTTTVLEQWGYAYDPAGNRSYEEHAGTGIISQTGQANRLQQRGGGGNLHVSGTVDKATSVAVNGQPARVTSTAGAAPFRFEKDLAVGTGTQTFSIVATDGSTPPQTTTQSYQVNVPADSQTYEHDSNGNLRFVRSGGSVVRGYTWDAANRLVGITYTDGSTTFQYDGMSQRRIITEKDATGAVTGTTQLLWKSGRVWQEQDSSGRVTKRYHFNGVQTLTYTGASTTPDSTTSTLTMTDHLGSHREMVTFSGGAPAITGRRDFDPYGKPTQTGTVPTNAAYTSHYLHDRSGLELALYRGYDPDLGRWLNEDQIAERGGLNLYGYVANSPEMMVDPLGLDPLTPAQLDLARNYGPGGTPFSQMNHAGLARGALEDLQVLQRTAQKGICLANSAKTVATQQTRLMAGTAAVRNSAGFPTAAFGFGGAAGAYTVATAVGTSSVGTAASAIGTGGVAGLAVAAAGGGYCIGLGIRAIPTGGGRTMEDSIEDFGSWLGKLIYQ